jgi:multicomponent K+:H+ antiporter subunit A
MAALLVGALLLLPRVTDEGALQYALEWAPQIGLSLTFYLDGLALLFVVLVTGIGVAVFHYAGHYFDDDDETLRFYRWLLVFTGAMLWLVVAGNLLVLFIAWELTSISSFMLIGFKGAKAEGARRGALQALMITGGGGLALIAGLLLMGTAAGSYELADVLQVSLADHPYYTAVLVLVALGAFTKSAQFPFQFWLPGAMSAPSPASAFLHSATMVKAGVYLLARMYPALGNTALWTDLLTVIGLLTLGIGSVLALRQRDLKGLLAYTTIAQLGTLVALIGQPEYAGFKALMVGILAHALYKAPLFLAAGVVDHATGTRIVDQLGGLRHRMPGLAILVVLACLSMAGMIPLLGFVGKETVLETFINQPVALAVVVVSAILTVAVALILARDVFWGPVPASVDAHFHEPARALLHGPGALALLGSVTGLLLPVTIIPLITPAVPKAFSLYLFPGLNTAFILSTLAIIAGIGVYVLRRGLVQIVSSVPLPSGEGWYERAVASVEWFADQLLRTQNGKLRYYLVVILGSVALLMLASGILPNALSGQQVQITLNSASDVLGVVLVLLSVGATLASIMFRNHLAAALSLGVMGYAVGGIFLLEPAPDVALVQFLVETLGTVLVIVMIGRISRNRRFQAMRVLWDTSRRGVWRDAAIAAIIGLTVGLFALTAINNRPERGTIAAWHLENAYPLTGVVDVVASILADFRATDTLIEIMVFSISAVGVLTLLTLSQKREQEGQTAALVVDPSPLNTPLARWIARLVLPVALLISLTHIFYAGDNPGDGFTAGVISGLGVTLWYIVFGYAGAKRRLSWLHPWWLIGGGLALALVNAVLPLIFGREFFALTKISGIAAPAGLHLASTLLFEFGIFLAVFGSASLIIESIAHPEGVEQVETQEMAVLQLEERGKDLVSDPLTSNAE